MFHIYKHGAIKVILSLLAMGIAFKNAQALEYRLGKSVVPEAYDITIKPYLLEEDGAKRFTFDGEVKILLHATAPAVREITLHKDYIEIQSARLYDANGNIIEDIPATSWQYESETDKLTVNLTDTMQPLTNYTLHFKYTGLMRNGTAGLYPASYEDADGNTKWMALTQLQRIDARVVFPCFDEPALKARFRMHISRPKQFNSKFNTRLILSELDGNDRYIDHFEETPRMSTYLVAIIVSEYVLRGTNDFVMLTRADHLYKTDYAMNVSMEAIEALDQYTKLPYKTLGNTIMQKASVPVFPHNGMENWGLVIYKDPILVHERNYTDGWSNKERTLTIIVHETSHMWFGNSVTFAWWSYFWLNEAFARYYQYFLAHQIHPEFHLDQQFVVNQVHLIFGTDAVNTTQPLTSEVDSIQTPAQIAYKFSGIAYAKGAAILRMIRNAMGHGNFDTAIQDYLQENHLQNTEPADLFKHLKAYWPATQQVDLDSFFKEWTEEVGFPILYVNSTETQAVRLQQKRFLLNSTDGSNTNISYTIPITYTTSNETNFDDLTPKVYFNSSDNELIINLDKPYDWIIFNLQQSNYHRVAYDENLLAKIHRALIEDGHGGISVINRAQIIDDLFNFAHSNLIDYLDVIEFLEYMKNEVEYLPWYAAFAGLNRLAQRLKLEDQRDMGRFIGDIGGKVYEKLGFASNNDTVLDVYNRNKVITWFCKYQQKNCNAMATAKYNQFELAGQKPPVDFRETLYCSANLRSLITWAKLSELYQNETVSTEREMLARAMGCTVYTRKLHYAYVLAFMQQSHIEMSITSMYSSDPENVTPTFEMIADTVERLATRLGSWRTTANIISNLANYFTEENQRILLEDFIAEKGQLFGDSISILQNAIKNVNNNLAWSDRKLPRVIEYLKERSSATQNACAAILLILASSISKFLS